MVNKENLIHLFIGQDIITQDGISRKDTTLEKIKAGSLNKGVKVFNQDVLYGRKLSLKDLQEKLLLLPVKTKKRIVVIKDAEGLKDEVKEFILGYAKKPFASIILVLDINEVEPRDTFIKRIYSYTEIHRFKEAARLDTFNLSRSIDSKNSLISLKILNQLLENGERPEWILGGLRYAWERNINNPLEIRKRLKLLLNCDFDIKMGRLKPAFVLERLILKLCSLG